MKKYVKRPLVIEAWRWDGEFLDGELPEDVLGKDGWRYDGSPGVNGLIIETLEGDMTSWIGDYIIKGIAGEFYPCRSEIFDATYEEVEEPSIEELEKARIDREAWEKENGDKLFYVPIRKTIS